MKRVFPGNAMDAATVKNTIAGQEAVNDLVIGKIQILHAQPRDFHEMQSAAIHDLHHQVIDAVYSRGHVFASSRERTVGTRLGLVGRRDSLT